MSHIAATDPQSVIAAQPRVRRVVTSMVIEAPVERVWDGLRYYEQLETRPPLLLRLLLPTPVRTVGRKSEVGDEALCEYRGGHLTKRVTEVEPHRFYRFEVISQDLPLHGAKLCGGAYLLESLAADRTRLSLETRYQPSPRSNWLRAPIEKQVCHAFHRHILEAMRAVIRSDAGR